MELNNQYFQKYVPSFNLRPLHILYNKILKYCEANAATSNVVPSPDNVERFVSCDSGQQITHRKP